MNRDQFIAALESTFYPQVFSDPFSSFEAVFTNDQAKMYDILTNYLRAQGRISFYLAEWDAAPDQPSKDAVAGSVTSDLGSASVDPSTAVLSPEDGGEFQLGMTNGLVRYESEVDGTSVGNTLLFTVPSGKTFVPLTASYVLSTVSGLAIVSTISMGSNSSTYNNISSATLLTGLSTQGEALNINLSSPQTVSGSTDIFVRVSIASTATTYNLKASIIGYYI